MPTSNSAIQGYVYNGKIGQPGVTVYLDPANKITFDPATMQHATTLADGRYTLTDVPAGPTIIRQVVPAGFVQVDPKPSAQYPHLSLHVTVGNPQVLTGQNFTNAPASSPANPPAVVVAPPVPSIAPVITLGRGITDDQPGWQPPMAPATLHISLHKSFANNSDTTDWRVSKPATKTTPPVYRNWSIVVSNVATGVVAGSPVGTFTAPMTAIILPAGTYSILATIDGVSTSKFVTIPPDTRTVSTLAATASIDNALLPANQTIQLAHGATYHTNGLNLAGKVNLRFEAVGDATLPPPVIFADHGVNVLSMDGNTRDITFSGVKFDGAWTAGLKGTMPIHLSASEIGNIRGTNITFDGTQHGNLRRAFDLAGPTGVLIQNCVTTDPTGITSQGLYSGGATGVVILNTIFRNYVGNEAAFRITEFNNTELWVDGCTFEVGPGCAGKSSATTRQGLRLYFSNCKSVGDIFSCDQDHTGLQFTDSSLFRDITQIGGGYIEVKPGQRGSIFHRLHSVAQYGPAIRYSGIVGSGNIFDACDATISALVPSAPSANYGFKFFSSDTSVLLFNFKTVGPPKIQAVGGIPLGWSALNAVVTTP